MKSVNFIKKQPAKVFCEKKASNSKKHQNKKSNFSKLCYRYGEQFSKGHLSNCKAFSKTCYSCGTKGPLSTVCKLNTSKQKSKVHQVHEKEESSESSEEEIFSVTLQNRQDIQPIVENQSTVNSVNTKTKLKYAQVKTGITYIKFIIDTGCSIDIIDKNTFDKLKKQTRNNIKL